MSDKATGKLRRAGYWDLDTSKYVKSMHEESLRPVSEKPDNIDCSTEV